MRCSVLAALADKLKKEYTDLYNAGRLSDAIVKASERIGILTALKTMAEVKP